MWQDLEISKGDHRALARSISLVENEHEGFDSFLRSLKPNGQIPVIGITGPPGAGKSTVVDALIRLMVNDNKKVAVLCVDPSSPFNLGAILGDRIRMSDWYNHPSVFIRSLATRGHMGGLSHKIIEITELLKTAPFDLIIVETVGVGQSEIEIAGLADTTVVVMVPEAGDEIQTMKSGLMEIADIFVVNKSDRPDADTFLKNLRMMLAPAFQSTETEIPIVKTVAHTGDGIEELYSAILQHDTQPGNKEKKLWLLTDKVYQIIQSRRMKTVDKKEVKAAIEKELAAKDLNLYRLASEFQNS